MSDAPTDDLDEKLRAFFEADEARLNRASPEERARILEERRVAREEREAETTANFLNTAALVVGKHLHRTSQRNVARELDVLLAGETDRGFVLVLASYLKFLLGELLRASVVETPAAKAYLRNNRAFHARQCAAAALGLISPAMSDDLDRIRQLRNELAHSWSHASLDAAIAASPDLSKLLDAVHHDVDPTSSARKRLHRAGLIVAGLIDRAIATATRPIPPANFDEQEFSKILLGSLGRGEPP